ncbi:hypothetical protein [Halococcus saccharolyticus]|uniref:Uncharacterized protein n=1 Tax=Halococcus saccharolyticus DSM 5350 TaxID=1227455 RepID=M0MK77_9EURY|nr:hypothetical protein [Halococcus saccharolyticus]EMA46082.1 hypothetical protein C449_05237 [Halococcus saccharolyticus DSM 5350]
MQVGLRIRATFCVAILYVSEHVTKLHRHTVDHCLTVCEKKRSVVDEMPVLVPPARAERECVGFTVSEMLNSDRPILTSALDRFGFQPSTPRSEITHAALYKYCWLRNKILMTETNDEDEQDQEDDEIVSAEDAFFVDQDLREENIQRVSFEYCETAKRVGQRYWRGEEGFDISHLTDEFDLSESEVRSGASTYYLIYDVPPQDLEGVSDGAYSVMVKYFRDLQSVEELADEEESGLETVRCRVREYVGGVLKHTRPEEVDLNEVDELPPPPRTLSERLSGAREFRSPDVSGLHSAMETATSVMETAESVARATRTSDAMARARRSTQFLQSAEYRNALRGLRVPSNAVRNTAELGEAVRRLNQRISFQNIGRRAREYITRAILEGITNFDSPADYDPDSVEVNPFVKDHGLDELNTFCDVIEEEADDELDAYLDRTLTGMAAYEQGDYITATFLFISVQDGLMAALCQWEHGPPSDGYYRADEKRETLQEVSTGYYGIEEHQLVGILGGFYDHRNAIMHGDPVAYFDENIATIALLFLVMTYEAVLNYRNG